MSSSTSGMVGIVRSFGYPDIRPIPTYVRKEKATPNEDEDTVTWGGAGNDIFALQATVKAEVPKPTSEEISRKYDVVRIENPNDSEQYVEAEVMTEYNARNTISKERTTLRFAKPEPSANVKILSRDNQRTSGTE